jgi:polyphosphate kinase 2
LRRIKDKGPAMAHRVRMAGKNRKPEAGKAKRNSYKAQLHDLQVELVKFQRHLIRRGEKILVIFEGRDAAGKDGVIKRITEHLSPRETRVVALGKPSDRDNSRWYFQRYAAHLPSAQELVLFNRSWYNRAGVERVMGFCTAEEVAEFMHSVPAFEAMLVRSGIKLFKYYLDIGKPEQRRRLEKRKSDPLTQWKTSAVDARALGCWKAYSAARNEMLARTHSEAAPWTLVRADDKKKARLNIMRDLLGRLHYAGKDAGLAPADRRIVFSYDPSAGRARQLAK